MCLILTKLLTNEMESSFWLHKRYPCYLKFTSMSVGQCLIFGLMCILIRSEPPSFQSPQCTRHGKTFDTRISISWLPDLHSYAVSVGQPGDRDSSIEGFSVTSALWRLKERRFTPDKYTHQTKNYTLTFQL